MRVAASTKERLVYSQPLIFPPRHERLGVREHTRPACRFDQLSSARASVVDRRNEVGLLPLELAKPLLRKAYARDAYARLLCCGINSACAGHTLLRRPNLISKSYSRALPRRFSSGSHVQPIAILDSSCREQPRESARLQPWVGAMTRKPLIRLKC
jgi:hypothetical protein